MRVSQALRVLSKSGCAEWLEPWRFFEAPVYSFGKVDDLPDSAWAAGREAAKSGSLMLPSERCLISCEMTMADGSTERALALCSQEDDGFKVAGTLLCRDGMEEVPGYLRVAPGGARFGKVSRAWIARGFPEAGAKEMSAAYLQAAILCLGFLSMRSCVKIPGKIERNMAPRLNGRQRREIRLRHVTVEFDAQRYYRERTGPVIGPGGVALHGVEGHWCSRQSSGDAFCSHVWTYDPAEPRRRSCDACGREGWWRSPHERGDQKFGVIVKDYVRAGVWKRRKIAAHEAFV